MPSPPDSTDREVLDGLLRRARRRVRWTRGTAGAAVGLLAVAITFALGAVPSDLLTSTIIGIVAAVIGAAIAILSGPSLERIAVSLEQRTPESRNLLLTGFEIADGRIAAAPYVAERVLRDAAALAQCVKLAHAMPVKRNVIAFASALVIAIVALTSRPLQSVGTGAGTSSGIPAVNSIAVTITPPPYSGQPTRSLRDPNRIDALAGSRLDITAFATAESLTLGTVAATQPFTLQSAGTFATSLVADTDGFISIEPRSATGAAGVRKLLGLAITPDSPPSVRITAPAKDLVVPDGRRSLKVAIEAEDDLQLGSLKLSYTRISGSGENFTFTGGEVPLTVERASVRKWSARVDWALGGLKLEPGDMVVYRGVASDRRLGEKPVESDSFFVEIAAPGAMPGEGFAIDDRLDKYAISQQMVIVKTERVLSARASLEAADFREQVLDLAAEQRQVRAEFVFMMGGELADAGLDMTSLNEEVEAAGEEDLAAGRAANQGRLDLLRAIRSMSRAAARLADADASGALPLEREALGFLQRAFARSRYILRTLGVRERLDLARRLTGLLTELAKDSRSAVNATPSPRLVAARSSLTEVATLAAEMRTSRRPDVARASAVAQRILSIDPSSEALREVASAVTASDFDRAATGLATFIRTELPSQSADRESPELRALAGAFADALRKEGGRR